MTVRFDMWNQYGEDIEGAKTSQEALELAGLDWTVEQHQVMDAQTGMIIPNQFTNVRVHGNECVPLGIVGNRYKIVQNRDAFDFTDALAQYGATFVKGGVFHNGAAVWLMAQLPSFMILGDSIDNYVVFINSHDGKGSVKCCVTPTRVACSNTLNFALKTASRKWSTTHTGMLEEKMKEAQRTLAFTENYTLALAEEAESLASRKLDLSDINHLNEILIPVEEGMSERQVNTANERRAIFMNEFYNADDLWDFKGTAWGYLNAVADYVDHAIPARNAQTYAESNWGNILAGRTMVDAAYEILAA